MVLMSEMAMRPDSQGKVRDLYDLGDRLLIVATDRISAFDYILKDEIPYKGEVLTRLSLFWFDLLADIIPNHLISADVADLPEKFKPYAEWLNGRFMLVRKAEMFPVECIVRGYLAGSGLKEYRKQGTVCGIELPAGLVEASKLPEPIYTPSTKAEIGDHDENIDFDRSAALLEKNFPGRGEEYARTIRDGTLALYGKCAAYALSRGIIIADTKFEFGVDENGRVVLGDEMLTPDSSRFWPLAGYEPGHAQPSFDKQFARDWYKTHPGNDGTLPSDVVAKTIGKYKEAYKLLTGKEL